MFDVEHYLAKLGWTGARTPDLATLRGLHKRHQMTVPFDNFLNEARGLAIWGEVEIDLDRTYDAVVVGGRGGVCYELNGLFRELLRRFGYDVVMVSAGVLAADGVFGPELEHLFTMATVDGVRYLVDVGYSGPSFIEPVRVDAEPQQQYGSWFRVVESDGFHVLQRRPRDGEWAPVYRFRDKPRQPSEWAVHHDDLDAYARQIAANVLHIRSRATDDGQLTLVGRRLLRVRDGREQVRVLIRPDDLNQALDEILLRA